MDVLVRMSEGRLTVPAAVREALAPHAGDRVLLRVEGNRATLERIPDLLELAGTIPVPAEVRDMPWSEVRRRAQAARPY